MTIFTIIKFLFLASLLTGFHGKEKFWSTELTYDDYKLASKRLYANQEHAKNFTPSDNDMDFGASPRTDYARKLSLWPHAKVIYKLNSNLNPSDKKEVFLAFANIRENTCVRFQLKNDTDKMSVDIRLDNHVCTGSVCQQPGGHVKLGPKCRNWNLIVHELMHTLCFTHEFERNDRDKWMSHVGCGTREAENINYTSQELLFDYLSATNYPCDQCRVARMPGVKNCGSSIGLSVLDADKINSLYDCQGEYSHRWRRGNEAQENLFYGGYYDYEGFNDRGYHLYSYICRAYYQGDIIVGQTDPNYNLCIIYYSFSKERYQYHLALKHDVLTNPYGANIRWIKPPGNKIPKNAIKGGQMNNGEILYIGSCWILNHEGMKIPVVMQIKSRKFSSFFDRSIFVQEYPINMEVECQHKKVLVNEGTNIKTRAQVVNTSPVRKIKSRLGQNEYIPQQKNIDLQTSSPYQPWRNGRVVYTLNPNLESSDKAEIVLALNYIEKNTCVRFETKRNQIGDSIEISRGDTICGESSFCSQPDGYIKIGRNCRNWTQIVHTFMRPLCISQPFGSKNILSVLDTDEINSLYDCKYCFSYKWIRWTKGKLINEIAYISTSFYSEVEPISICRANLFGNTIPGFYDAQNRVCKIRHDGVNYLREKDYQILSKLKDSNLYFGFDELMLTPINSSSLSNHIFSIQNEALKAGSTREGETLYVGLCEDSYMGAMSWGQSTLVNIQLSMYPNITHTFNGIQRICTRLKVLVCAVYDYFYL